MKHIASTKTLSRTLSRVSLALALFLGTFAVTRVSSAQSSYVVAALQAAESSTSTSFSYLTTHVSELQLEAAVTYLGSESATNSTINSTFATDIKAIQANMPSSPTAKGDPDSLNAVYFIVPYITGIDTAAAAGSITTPGTGLNAAAFTADASGLANAFATYLPDSSKSALAYYLGWGADALGADNAIPAIAAGVTSQITATSLANYYTYEVGINSAYVAWGAHDYGIIPLVAYAAASQTEVGVGAPTPAFEAATSEIIGGGLTSAKAGTPNLLLETGTYVETQVLLTSGSGAAAAANIAAAFAAPYASVTGSMAQTAAAIYQSVSPAIAGAVANIEYGQINSIAQDVAAVTPDQYAAAIVAAIDGAPNVSSDGTKADALRELVAENVIYQHPLTAAADAGAAAATLSSDASRATLAYLLVDQVAGTLPVNGVSLSGYINEAPSIAQEIEATVPASDTNRVQASYLIALDAAYPMEYYSAKGLLTVTPILYTQLALQSAQAQVGGTYLPYNVQAAIAGGVAVLFGPASSIAITTSTAVVANALNPTYGGSDGAAPNIVAAFASYNTTLAGDVPYIAGKAASLYGDQAVAISATGADLVPYQAPLVAYQVALVSNPASDVAIAHAIDITPGVTSYAKAEYLRETAAQDIIEAQPTEDVLVAGAVGQDLTSDADREYFAELLGDELTGVDVIYALPAGATALSKGQDEAGVAAALAGDLNSTGAALTKAVYLLAYEAALPLSPLDKYQKSTAWEQYIPSIPTAIAQTQVEGSYLSPANEAMMTSVMVASYGTEVIGNSTVGQGIVTGVVNASISQNPTAIPTVAYTFSSTLLAYDYTYAPTLSYLTATGQSPILAGQTGAAVIAGAQFGKGVSIGALAVTSATAANVITPGYVTHGSTLAATELNDNLNYVAQGLAADSALSTTGTTVYLPYDSTLAGALSAVVTGTDRAAAGITNIFTNKISSLTETATLEYYVDLITQASVKADPKQAPDILGYVIASLEQTAAEQAVNGVTPYTSDASWAAAFANPTTKGSFLYTLLHTYVLLVPGVDSVGVNLAFNDITAASPGGAALAIKDAYLAGDYGPITWNETPVVNN